MVKSILILGSSGTIGNNLKLFLKKKSFQIIEYDILNTSSQDLRNTENLLYFNKCLDDCDYVFFLAYDVGGSKYLNSIINKDYLNDNIKIMMNVFNNLKNKPFIFASTQMQNMYNDYGSLKRIGEMYTNHLNGINVRFWNVYDKEEYGIKSHVITDFIYKSKNHNNIDLLTDGNEERQFLHADDCSEGLYNIMINHDIHIKKKTIDLTSFEWIKIIDIANIIKKINNCNITIKNKKDTTQPIKNEPNNYILDYWHPKISLIDGINNLYNNN
jgi:nucleoside-diphosphate-sugar epimerase